MGFFKSVGKAGLKGTGDILGKIGNASIFGAEKIGKTAIGLGKKVGTNSANNIIRTAAAIGTGAVVAGTLADLDGNTDREKATLAGAGVGLLASAIPGVSAGIGYAGAVGAASILGAGEAVGKLGSKMIKMPDKLTLANTDEINLTKFGNVAIFGSALAEGTKEAVDYFKRSRQGVNDGLLRTATPVVPIQTNQQPSYSNNGGATGDLVFALNNLRRG